MAKSNSQKSKRRNGLLRIAVVLFVCFICYTIVKLQIGISQMRTRLEEIEDENTALQMTIEEQKITLEQGTTKENVEQMARDRLNYVYPDEIIYTDLP